VWRGEGEEEGGELEIVFVHFVFFSKKKRKNIFFIFCRQIIKIKTFCKLFPTKTLN